MKLEFKDYLTDIEAIEQIYFEAFPEEDRYPFWTIKQCAESEDIDFQGIYMDGRLIGFVYLIHYLEFVYLFYLAVKADERNHGCGSQILQDLIAKYPDKKLLLCIDAPNNKDEMRDRRRSFYLRNGLYSTNTILDNHGYLYEILCSDRDFKPSKDIISAIYKTLAPANEAGNTIRQTLEVEDIKLQNKK